MMRTECSDTTPHSTDAVAGTEGHSIGEAAEGAGAFQPSTFRDRMRQRTSAVQQQVEADEWRVINATRGKCTTCRVRFGEGERIVWREGTRQALHPTCFATTYPLLNTPTLLNALRVANSTSHQTVEAAERERRR